MKNKKLSIITSSIAACAILASLITFNGFAAESKNAGIPKTENNVTALNTDKTITQGSVLTETNAAPAATPVSINTTSANNTACPLNQNSQSSSNVQTNIKSANITKVISNLQNAIDNANCNKTTAKTRNTSALQSRIDSLLKSLNISSTATETNISSAVKPSSSAESATPEEAITTAAGNYSTFQKRVVDLVNKERAKRGLKPLKMNSKLNNTATLKSKDMAKLKYFSHTSPTYGSPFNMMKNFGIRYRTAGENIAMGQTTPEQVMKGWMNSPGHRANILKSSFTQIGVGVAKGSNGRLYWTQQFIG